MKKIKFKNGYINIKREQSEEYFYITAFSIKGEKIGSITTVQKFIDHFIEDEIQYFKEDYQEQFHEEEFEHEIQLLNNIEENISEKTHAYLISELKVEEKYRQNGFGRLLIDLVFEELEGMMHDSIIYLNACPERHARKVLSLDDLVEFYKQSGFKESYHQGTNVNMILTSKEDMNVHNDIKKDSQKKLLNKKGNNVTI